MSTCPRKSAVCAFAICAALLVGACSDSPQQQAYEHAVKREQQLPRADASALVAEYQRIVRLEPGSTWARKAQVRIDALEAQIKAEELHQSVFQEHGVD